jgi:hypothetical protein
MISDGFEAAEGAVIFHSQPVIYTLLVEQMATPETENFVSVLALEQLVEAN